MRSARRSALVSSLRFWYEEYDHLPLRLPSLTYGQDHIYPEKNAKDCVLSNHTGNGIV